MPKRPDDLPEFDVRAASPRLLALTRCRACESDLLQLDRIWWIVGNRRVADRRCPECGRRDSVLVDEAAIIAWFRRERRLLADLRQAVRDTATG